MSLISEQIVAVVAARVAGLPTCGANVFIDRNDPIDDAHSPCIDIATPTENVETMTLPAPRRQQRDLTIVITISAKASDARTILKTAQLEIEKALALPSAGLPLLSLTSVTMDYDRTAEKPIGQAALSYSATYYCAENAPDVAP